MSRNNFLKTILPNKFNDKVQRSGYNDEKRRETGALWGQKYGHLTKEEQDMIAVLKAKGISLSGIAREIGRHKSTVFRELNRNAPSTYKVYYLSHKAQERAKNRWAVTHKRQRLKNKEIREYVEGYLKRGWSSR